jgi:hypothetical protein
MKKLHKSVVVAAAMLFAAPFIQAQPDNFYRYLGNYDHGIGREVVQSIDAANPGYVVAGTAYIAAPNNMPGISVSAYTPAGLPIWSHIYPVNNGMPSPNTTADAVSIASAPALGTYGVLAYSDFTTPSQSVLFQINLAGGLTPIWTSLGDMRATSVIWDPAINCFVVLGQAPINNGDLQMIVVNAAGAIVFTSTYDSGGNFIDTPSRLMLDPATGGYTLVGTSQNNITMDRDVFVVRISPGFGLFCSETIGNPGVDELGVDVTWGVNSAGVSTDIILANQRGGTIMPMVIEMDPFACPGYISSTLIDPYKTPNNMATSITTDPFTNNICIAGENFDINTNGFVTVLNPAFVPLAYTRYGQPGLPGNEDLTDILFDAGANQIITTGEHELINPWPGFPTPPNEFFIWLPMMNNIGFGMCPDNPPVNAYPLCPVDVVYNIQNPYFVNTPVSMFEFRVRQVFLNECTNPFRVGEDNSSGNTGATVFPNPANKTVSVMYNVPESDEPVLQVTNMLGEIVLTKPLSSSGKTADVDVSGLAPGMYFFRVHSGDIELANEKITIQR